MAAVMALSACTEQKQTDKKAAAGEEDFEIVKPMRGQPPVQSDVEEDRDEPNGTPIGNRPSNQYSKKDGDITDFTPIDED